MSESQDTPKEEKKSRGRQSAKELSEREKMRLEIEAEMEAKQAEKAAEALANRTKKEDDFLRDNHQALLKKRDVLVEKGCTQEQLKAMNAEIEEAEKVINGK